MVDCYVVAFVLNAWDEHYIPTLYTYGVQRGVNRIVCLRHTQTFINHYMTYNIANSFSWPPMAHQTFFHYPSDIPVRRTGRQ